MTVLICAETLKQATLNVSSEANFNIEKRLPIRSILSIYTNELHVMKHSTSTYSSEIYSTEVFYFRKVYRSMMNGYLFICAVILPTVFSVPTTYFAQQISSFQSSSQSTGANLTDLVGQKSYVIKTITSVPLYRIVGYFTNRTEETEAKVHDLQIPHAMYYTHIYLAWKSADQLMSSITLESDGPDGKLNGANLVLSTSRLGDMYAPGLITPVLDFVTKCYDWAKPRNSPIQ
ncbi:unnamed protein product [Heterobilharzia americana]|nr:unnamed protein product [Heterobilharzia americana]